LAAVHWRMKGVRLSVPGAVVLVSELLVGLATACVHFTVVGLVGPSLGCGLLVFLAKCVQNSLRG